MKLSTITFSLIACVIFGLANSGFGHEIFQDVLKEKYTLKSFSCKSCHPDSDNRKIRSKFADEIYKEMKDKNYSQKFAEAEAKGEEAVKEFDAVVAKDFAKAWESVKNKQLTFDEMIKLGLFNGARLDEKKLAEKAAAEDGK